MLPSHRPVQDTRAPKGEIYEAGPPVKMILSNIGGDDNNNNNNSKYIL